MAVWVVGGTTEGRKIACWLAEQHISVILTVATGYGAAVLPSLSYLTVVVGRLAVAEMDAFLAQYQPVLVIDATHPYAREVTINVQQACQRGGYDYIRVVRPKSKSGDWLTVDSATEAVEVLSHTQGNIFLTTGSKDLEFFARLPDYKERIFLRILPSRLSLDKALTLGFPPSRIICMQGPFSQALNQLMFQECKAMYVVTKDSGITGGFPEKVRAAKEAGSLLMVLKRTEEDGILYREIVDKVQRYFPHIGGPV
ncbi:precorrin-6A reductase [Megasphaera sp. UPII 135-E]|uniref:precorrin-6A reductase n=1 Tax=Megasphaera sp. UPII 135-E TaxID=1000569 RepID=UPI00021A1B5B|nr:precorrin-6A reductase [Megasphaera sp. UPII 135-E]EGS36716.1 precorrin-6A reductase [Megasphaera sp. UPII 135-E]MUP48624.1 precorrin-6A reductase [Veillonellaceae bacterium M2-8]